MHHWTNRSILTNLVSAARCLRLRVPNSRTEQTVNGLTEKWADHILTLLSHSHTTGNRSYGQNLPNQKNSKPDHKMDTVVITGITIIVMVYI